MYDKTHAFGVILQRAQRVFDVVMRLVSMPRMLTAHHENSDTLDRALTSAQATLRAFVESAAPSEADQARALLVELGELRLAVRTYELSRRTDALDGVTACLHRMRSAGSVTDLAERIPYEVVMLGFNRALFSWIDHARWVPRSAFTRSGPLEARAMIAAGTAPYWHTRDVIEAEMIRSRAAMRVDDARSNPRVHKDLLAVTQSHSYIAAPLVSQSRVVGFLHADENIQTGTVDNFDRDLLGMFAEGVGFAVERATVLDQVRTVQSRVDHHMSALQDLMGELGHPVDGTSSGAGRGYSSEDDLVPEAEHVAGTGWSSELTRREQEVLRMIGSGLTNAQIADRLYIAEGTAKSHVKSIYRKLGTSNRAEAASIYHEHIRRRSQGPFPGA
jgi:DNA-binding CsgD family transcriptional regulator